MLERHHLLDPVDRLQAPFCARPLRQARPAPQRSDLVGTAAAAVATCQTSHSTVRPVRTTDIKCHSVVGFQVAARSITCSTRSLSNPASSGDVDRIRLRSSADP